MVVLSDIAIVEVSTLVPAGGGITASQYTDITARLAALEAANNVTAADIAANAVTTAKILDGNVTFAKLATAAVGVGASQVAPGTHTHLTPTTRGTKFRNEAATASTTPSTTNTATTVQALQVDVALPAGTWTLYATGGGALQRDVAGDSFIEVEIDGQVGVGRSADCPVTAPGMWRMVVDNHQLSGVLGNRNVPVRIRFKSVDSGRTFCENPWVEVQGERDV